MKQKDIMVIVMIAGMSAIVSYFVSNALISSPKNHQQQVEVVEAISSDFSIPDKNYFNQNSLNPTQTIQIGTGSNTKPFSD